MPPSKPGENDMMSTQDQLSRLKSTAGVGWYNGLDILKMGLPMGNLGTAVALCDVLKPSK
jgi:hypothetical protein